MLLRSAIPSLALALAAGLLLAAEPPVEQVEHVVEIPGTVTAKRGGDLQVTFEPAVDTAPAVGDRVEFSVETRGIRIGAGAGEVIEVGENTLWVRVTDKNPRLGMDAVVRATGTPDITAILDEIRARVRARDCRPADADVLKRYAEAGHARAPHELGVAYVYGCGVPQDDETAMTWFRRAAEQGFPRAMADVAGRTGYGIGTEKNPDVALHWARKAAAAGDPLGYYALGNAYELGWGTSVDQARANAEYARAAAWAKTAAAEGDAYGLFFLAFLTENGAGVTEDMEAAAELYQQAHAAGFYSTHHLDRVRQALADSGAQTGGQARDSGGVAADPAGLEKRVLGNGFVEMLLPRDLPMDRHADPLYTWEFRSPRQKESGSRWQIWVRDDPSQLENSVLAESNASLEYGLQMARGRDRERFRGRDYSGMFPCIGSSDEAVAGWSRSWTIICRDARRDYRLIFWLDDPESPTDGDAEVERMARSFRLLR